MATLSPTELLAQLQTLASDPPSKFTRDPVLRHKLCMAAKGAFLALERPEDVPLRLLITQPVENIIVRIAYQLRIFFLLYKEKSLVQLAQETGAEPALLVRIMRGLAAFGAVQEVGKERYTLSRAYKYFAFYADPMYNSEFRPEFCSGIGSGLGSGLGNYAEYLIPPFLTLPEYLYSCDYQNPLDRKNTTLNVEFNRPDKPVMDIISEREKVLDGFLSLTTGWYPHSSYIQDLYPIKEFLSKGHEESTENAMWVEVGGGSGSRTVPLRRDFPNLSDRFIVQDLPNYLSSMHKFEDNPREAGSKRNNYSEDLRAKHEGSSRNPRNRKLMGGVESSMYMAHDFLTKEQPVREARAYYIRKRLHDLSDDECVQVCARLRRAMKPGFSKLFIHEIVVPAEGASIWVVTQDINMMALCGTTERTEEQWRHLLEKAGLKLLAVHEAKDDTSDAVMEIEVKTAELGPRPKKKQEVELKAEGGPRPKKQKVRHYHC